MNTGTLKTNDLGLTAALLSQGCTLAEDKPFIKLQTEHGSTMTFYFQVDDKIENFVKIWDDPQLDPEHAIAHMRIFNMNRIGLIKEAKEAVGLVQITKNGKSVVVSSNLPEDKKAKILSRL